jgi:hypothetical protein
MYFDGTGDYLYRPNNPFTFLTSDFTIEMWYYQTGGSGFRTLFSTRTSADGGGNATIFCGLNGSSQLYYDGSTSGSLIIAGTTVLSNNTWNHIALVRSGSTVRFYLNGTSEGTVTDANSKTNADLWIGGQTTLYAITGYIDEFRISRFARYTGSTFTVPTAAFPVQ